MHEDYLFRRSPQERALSGWQTYRGALPAKVTMGLLAGGLLWHLILIVGKVLAPTFFSGPEVSVVATMTTLGLYFATAVAFIVWFYRAYQAVNLATGTAHSPDQAAWTFLVPILNLFRPYQIATEIWRKTSPNGRDVGHSPLLIGWWALWLVGRGSPLFVMAMVMGSEHAVLGGTTVFAGLAELALTGSAIAVVRTLDARVRAQQSQGTAPATF